MRLLALFLFALAPAAHADDDAWKGFYGGLGVGGAKTHSTWTTDATFGTLDEPVDHKASGVFGSAQFGYRWQPAQHLVLGLELALYPGRTEERTEADIAAANRERVTKIEHPAAAALVLGVAGASSLVYVRGGAAYSRIELQAINHQVGNVATWDTDAWGWTAGAGLEFQVRKHWSLGLEYNYAKLKASDQKTINSGGVEVRATDFQTRMNLYLLRANYRY